MKHSEAERGVYYEERQKMADYIFEHLNFDEEMHRQGKCSFSTLVICSAEEHKIKNIVYDYLSARLEK